MCDTSQQPFPSAAASVAVDGTSQQRCSSNQAVPISSVGTVPSV